VEVMTMLKDKAGTSSSSTPTPFSIQKRKGGGTKTQKTLGVDLWLVGNG
jgi:hypothetical protein